MLASSITQLTPCWLDFEETARHDHDRGSHSEPPPLQVPLAPFQDGVLPRGAGVGPAPAGDGLPGQASPRLVHKWFGWDERVIARPTN